MRKITGIDAIEYAEEHGLLLNKYADPMEGAREFITPYEARCIAEEDPSLVWVWEDTGAGRYVIELRRAGQSEPALSTAIESGDSATAFDIARDWAERETELTASTPVYCGPDSWQPETSLEPVGGYDCSSGVDHGGGITAVIVYRQT